MTLIQRILTGHRYRLQYDDRPDEFITAIGPTEAVRYREDGTTSVPPHTITDETAVREWMRGMKARAFAAIVEAEVRRQEFEERRHRDDNLPRYLTKGRKKSCR